MVIDAKYYIADVSFGTSSQLREPLELISGKDQPFGVIRLTDQRDAWLLEKNGRKPKILNPDFAKSSLVGKI